MSHEDIKILKYRNTNCYLLYKKILVDTDWAGTLQYFYKCIKQNNVAMREIEFLFITHFHPDHMGIAQELAESGIKIIVFEEQREYIHSSDKIFEKEKNNGFKPIKEENIIVIPCADSRRLLQSVGIKGEVIHTPGHSDDSISILLDEGVAIVGDLYPIHSVAAYDNEELENSWNMILAHKVELVYYGHAKPDNIKDIHSLTDLM